MNDFDEFGNLRVSKINRRRKLLPKTHSILIGPPPPTGIHTEDPKNAQRKLHELIEKVRR